MNLCTIENWIIGTGPTGVGAVNLNGEFLTRTGVCTLKINMVGNRVQHPSREHLDWERDLFECLEELLPGDVQRLRSEPWGARGRDEGFRKAEKLGMVEEFQGMLGQEALERLLPMADPTRWQVRQIARAAFGQPCLAHDVFEELARVYVNNLMQMVRRNTTRTQRDPVILHAAESLARTAALSVPIWPEKFRDEVRNLLDTSLTGLLQANQSPITFNDANYVIVQV